MWPSCAEGYIAVNPSAPAAEDALLPVLNKRAHLLLDSYNKLRGVVATPLNVSAVVAGQPDPGAPLAGTTGLVFGKCIDGMPAACPHLGCH